MTAGRAQSLGVRNEIFVGALSACEASLVVAGGHVSGPEQIFLRLVDPVVDAVQFVEIDAGVLEDVVGGHASIIDDQPDTTTGLIRRQRFDWMYAVTSRSSIGSGKVPISST